MLYPTRADQASWVPVAAGVVAIFFGLAAIFWPGLTLGVLLTLFGIYALAYGAVALVAAFRLRGEHANWWTQLLIGIVGIAAGLITLFYPGVTSVLLVYFIAGWALAIGVAEVVGAVTLRVWTLGVVGAVTAAVGLVLFANAEAGALALLWAIGALALVRGVLLLIQAAQPALGPQARG